MSTEVSRRTLCVDVISLFSVIIISMNDGRLWTIIQEDHISLTRHEKVDNLWSSLRNIFYIRFFPSLYFAMNSYCEFMTLGTFHRSWFVVYSALVTRQKWNCWSIAIYEIKMEVLAYP